MAWSLISKLNAILDAAVYVTGYTPTGVDVGADIVRILAKTDEIIDEGVATEATLATTNSDLDALELRVDGHAVLHTNELERIGALEDDVSEIQGGVLYVHDSASVLVLTPEVYQSASFFVIKSGSVALSPGTGVADEFDAGFGQAVIINATGGSLNLGMYTSGGSWLDGSSYPDSLPLAAGESVTVYPVDVGGNDMHWAILAGKTYADLA